MRGRDKLKRRTSCIQQFALQGRPKPGAFPGIPHGGRVAGPASAALVGTLAAAGLEARTQTTAQEVQALQGIDFICCSITLAQEAKFAQSPSLLFFCLLHVFNLYKVIP